MTANLGYRVEVENGNSVQNLNQVAGAVDGLDRKMDAAGDSAGQMGNSVRAASNQTSQATQSVIQFGSKIQGAVGSVQAMVGALGGQNRTAGLIASMAGAAVQGASLGSMFGPQGALVGAILNAAIPAIVALTSQHNQAAEAARAHRQEIDALVTATRTLQTESGNQDAIAQAVANPSLARGYLTQFNDQQLSDEAARRREEANQQRDAAEEARRRFTEYTARGGVAGQVSESWQEEFQAYDRALRSIDVLEQETERRREVAAEAQTERDAARVRALEEQGERVIATAQAEATRDAAAAARARAAAAVAAHAQLQRDGADLFGETNAAQQARAGDVLGSVDLSAGVDSRAAQAEAARASLDAYTLSVQANREAMGEWVDGMGTWQSNFQNMIDLANEGGNSFMSLGEMASTQLASIGGSALQTFGKAATDALMAVITGAKDVGTALLDALQQTLLAIGQESLVRALFELAQGIADTASYKYDSAGLHYAAAGVYAGVAAVTLGAGAGMAAARQGGSGSPQGSSVDRDNEANRNSQRNQAQEGGITIVVNNPLDSERQIGQVIQNSLDSYGRRM